MGSFRKWSQDGQAVSVKALSPLLSESFPGMSWDRVPDLQNSPQLCFGVHWWEDSHATGDSRGVQDLRREGQLAKVENEAQSGDR